MSSEPSSPSDPATKDDTTMAEPTSSSSSSRPVITDTDDTPMAEPSESVITEPTTAEEPSSSSEPVFKGSEMMAGLSWLSNPVVTVFSPTRAEPTSSLEPIRKHQRVMTESSSSSNPVITDSTAILPGPSSSSETFITDPTVMTGDSSSSNPVITTDSTMLTGPSSSSESVISKDSTVLAGSSSSSEPVTKDSATVAGSPSSSSPVIIQASTTISSEPVFIKDPTTVAGSFPSSLPVRDLLSSLCAGRPPRPKRLTVFGPRLDRKAKGKEKLTYDFYLLLKPSTKFRHCIAALSNHQLNPSRMGLLQVDELGLKITVFSIDQSEEDVYGFLNLEPEYFNLFECITSVTKMINLEIMLCCLSTGDDAYMLTVYSVHESNQVTLVFERDAKREVPGTLSVVDLLEEDPTFRRLPQIIYGFESSIPSTLLRPLAEQILEHRPCDRPNFVSMNIHPAKVEVFAGDYSVESATRTGEVWMDWPFWEALKMASLTSDKCAIYLATEPAECILLLFKMSDPDDTLCFDRGTFVCDQELSCLAFLRSLT